MLFGMSFPCLVIWNVSTYASKPPEGVSFSDIPLLSSSSVCSQHWVKERIRVLRHCVAVIPLGLLDSATRLHILSDLLYP